MQTNFLGASDNKPLFYGRWGNTRGRERVKRHTKEEDFTFLPCSLFFPRFVQLRELNWLFSARPWKTKQKKRRLNIRLQMGCKTFVNIWIWVRSEGKGLVLLAIMFYAACSLGWSPFLRCFPNITIMLKEFLFPPFCCAFILLEKLTACVQVFYFNDAVADI